MNYIKTDPVGIDVHVNRIQNRIYPALEKSWGKLDIYGRVYKKSTKDGISLERFTTGGEYEKVLFSEGNKIFFIQGDNPVMNSLSITNDLWVIAVVNIDKIKQVDHRGDEEVHGDLITALSGVINLKAFKGLEYGMKNLKSVVEDEFTYGNFKYTDIHPYHVFLVKTEATYTLIENKCLN